MTTITLEVADDYLDRFRMLLSALPQDKIHEERDSDTARYLDSPQFRQDQKMLEEVNAKVTAGTANLTEHHQASNTLKQRLQEQHDHPQNR